MNAHEIERYEALLNSYGLGALAYNPAYIDSFAETRLEDLFNMGVEEGEEVDGLNFLYMNAERYAGVLEDREADEAYDRWLATAMNRRRIDPFYQII